MLGTAEFYDIMKMFETEFKGEGRFDREDKNLWSKGYCYQNGEINRLFKAYIRGVAFGKAYYRD